MSPRKTEPGDGLFRPIRLERVSEKVAGQLREVISSGVLKIGDRLPSERDLAEQMGVSRASVREALQILAAQGIVESFHGGGSVVRNITDEDVRRPIQIFLESDRRRVLELTEVRAFMEAWAAREAALNWTEPELAGIRGYLEEMERDFAAGQIRFEVDFKFHAEIAAATHNTIFVHLIDSIYGLISYSVQIHREQVFVAKEDQATILSHHRTIFEAISNRDPDAAETAMKEHLLFVVASFKKWSGVQ
jgi:GntR family transcriptional repressor for pyruvate dehydrogenase complex